MGSRKVGWESGPGFHPPSRRQGFSTGIVGDVQELKDRRWYEEQSSASLRQSLRVAAETNEVGQKAAEELNAQTGENTFVLEDSIEPYSMRAVNPLNREHGNGNYAERSISSSEQISRIKRDADDISHNLDTSQYLIRGMKSVWGSIVQMFDSPPTASMHTSASAGAPTSTARPERLVRESEKERKSGFCCSQLPASN